MSMTCHFDIYEYFNSRDVAEHCKNIGHKLTAIETAYMVWHSNHHTLAEKHSAWQKIIDTMPDEIIFDDNDISLHEFLRVHIQQQKEYLRNFITERENHIYQAKFLPCPTNTWDSSEMFYDDYHECLKAAKISVANNAFGDDIIRIKIVKYSHGLSPSLNEEIVFNKQFQLIGFSPLKRNCNLEDKTFNLSMPTFFREMKLSVSSPFQKGDLVVNVYDTLFGVHRLFVLDDFTFPHREEKVSGLGVDAFRLINAWCMDDSGDIDYKSGLDFLDFEFFRDKTTKSEKLLSTISAYLKGDVHLATLLYTHSRLLKDCDNFEDDDLPF